MDLEKGKIDTLDDSSNSLSRIDQKRKLSSAENDQGLSSDDELYGFSDKDLLTSAKSHKKVKTNAQAGTNISAEENGGDINIPNKSSVAVKNGKMFSRSTPKDVILTSNVLTGKRVCKPKGPKGASPPPEGWTATKALQNINRLYLPSSRSPPKKDTIKVNKKYELCIGTCSLQNGIQFDVQCIKCNKEFHLKCVNQDKMLSPIQKKNRFICKDCEIKIADESMKHQKEKSGDKKVINTSSKDKNIDVVKSNINKSINKNKNCVEKHIDETEYASKDMPQSLAVIKGKKYVVIKRPNVITSNKITNESDSNVQKKVANEKLKTKKNKDPKHVNKKELESNDEIYMENSVHSHFFRNVSIGYEFLFNTFQYLTIKELLCCARVCRMWNLISNHKMLWKTVRMKNSYVENWDGFADALSNNHTKHLDLRKMITTSQKEDTETMWENFSKCILKVKTLTEIHLCKCPTTVVEQLFSNDNLKVIVATSLSGEQELNFENLTGSKNINKLKLRGIDTLIIKEKSISNLQQLSNIVHLSLTSFGNITSADLFFLNNLKKLECFEFGDCNMITSDFATDLLPNLTRLKKLRLENGKDDCPTEDILEAISKMPNMIHLELINFDLKAYFDKKLAACTNLKKLLLIPTYQQQSATTNHIILNGVLKLASLELFTWVVTIELIRVTALYVVQYDDCSKTVKSKRKSTSNNSGFSKDNYDECIPVLKPVPGIVSETDYFDPIPLLQPNNPDIMPQIEILPLEKIKTILNGALPTTIFNIIKVPFINTWKQTLLD